MPAPATSQLNPPAIELPPVGVTAPLSVDAPAAPLAPQHYEARSRVRRRRAHQPLRVSPWLSLLGAVLLSQVVALLWLQGMAMTARNRASKLDRDSSAAQLQIERTRNAVAQRLADESQIDGWAAQGGWHQAGQGEFDNITDLKPYAPPEAVVDTHPSARSTRR